MRHLFLCFSFFVLLFACQSDSTISNQKVKQTDPLEGLTISSEVFGQTTDGTANLYTLTNKNGMEIKITNYGGIIVSLKTPDKAGNLADIVLGFEDLEGYRSSDNPYFGGIIGRYGNRIGKGKFTLDGQTYRLATNDESNHLHGGDMGFDKVMWEAQETKEEDAMGLVLTYLSKDMEEGYPGNLNVKVYYLLNNKNELILSLIHI